MVAALRMARINPAGPWRRGALLVAVGMSVLLHAAVGWGVLHRPLGRVDPASLRGSPRFVRIVRAPDDLAAPTVAGALAQQASPQERMRELIDESLRTTMAPPPPSLRSRPTGADDLPPRDAPEPPAVPLDALPLIELPTLGSNDTLPRAAEPASSRAVNQALRGTLLLPGSTGTLSNAAGSAAPGVSVGVERPARELTPLRQDVVDYAGLVAQATQRLDLPVRLDDDFTFTLWKHAGTFRLDIEPRASLRKLRTMPKDVVFLIDTSGSVSSRWLREVVRGVDEALDHFNEGDRFNLVVFKDEPVFFSDERIVPWSAESVAAARAFLGSRRSGGRTDVNRALARLLVRDVELDRVYLLVLISDGLPTRGVKDTRELINLITRDNALAASIYTVGIGPKQNGPLLEFLATANRGEAVSAAKEDQAAFLIRDLIARLRFPILKQLDTIVAGVDRSQVVPVQLPNVYQSGRLALLGRYEDLAQLSVSLTGISGGSRFEFTFRGDLATALEADATLETQWATRRLHALYAQRITRGESPELSQQIDALESRYGLGPPYE